MEKRYIPGFLVFLVFSLLFFVGGIVLISFGISRMYLTYVLSKSETSEEATVKEIRYNYRGFEDSVFFSMDNEERPYRVSLLRLTTGSMQINEKINIIFNSKRNFYIIKQYTNAFFYKYVVYIIFSFLLFYVFFVCFKAVKTIYKIDKVIDESNSEMQR